MTFGYPDVPGLFSFLYLPIASPPQYMKVRYRSCSELELIRSVLRITKSHSNNRKRRNFEDHVTFITTHMPIRGVHVVNQTKQQVMFQHTVDQLTKLSRRSFQIYNYSAHLQRTLLMLIIVVLSCKLPTRACTHCRRAKRRNGSNSSFL